MNFTFYSENLLETITAMDVIYHSGIGAGDLTDTAANMTTLIDRTSTAQMPFSIPATRDYAGIVYTFSSASLISFVQLKNMNFKKFQIGYDAFATMTLTAAWGGTTTSDWSGFSGSNVMIEFPTITAASITIRIYTTTATNPLSGLIGEVIVGDKILRLPRNPDAKGYDPELANQKFEVKTVDGGSVVYNQTAKFSSKLKLEWVDQSTTTDLLGLYNQSAPFTFTPYPTISSWQGESYECNWVDVFDFLQNKYNYRGTPYYAGTLLLKETPL